MTLGDMRIVLPEQVTRSCIKGVDQAPPARRVEHAVLNERGRFESAQSSEIERPGEPKPASRLFIDLLKAAKPLLGIVAPVGEPICWVRVGSLQRGIIHHGYTIGGATPNPQNDDR